MDVSVVIRAKNEAEFIGDTLRRVAEQRFDGTHEVIVVDSESSDETPSIAERHKAKVIRIGAQDFTYGKALNLGADAAEGRFIVNLSAHALPADEAWLGNLLCEFEMPEVAGVYGRQLSHGHENPFDACRNESFFGNTKKCFNRENRKALRHVHFSNSNSAVRREIWKQCKFDEDVGYAEDVLWQRAVISAGYTIVYAPSAAVYHTHPLRLQSAFRNSRNCARALASLAGKQRSTLLILYDLAVFLTLMASGLHSNLSYIVKNKHFHFLKTTPTYVLAEGLGWLVGRMGYRIAKS
ncbi:MAG: glycosyltransferase [Thermodesulfobacteriota bacterium]|nr:glycosyltransferase [Thermodesulfobacteriota bacterium]